MSATLRNPNVSSADRLGLMIFLALALHAVVILGITFQLSDTDPAELLPTLEITLVHSRTEEEPDKADYLAQANQSGGGNVDDKVRPSSPMANPEPTEQRGVAPDSQPAMAPPPQPPRPQQREVMAAAKAEQHLPVPPEHAPPPLPETQINAAQLIERSREIAQLSAEIQQRRQAYQQKPRHTYVSGANAKEYVAAAYMDSWRTKVERIGNLNYPDEARRRGLTGGLLLDVAINQDGTIHSIEVVRSSGQQVLDDAAVRIVRLSAPFAPLPKQIREHTDVLHIVRTWQFRGGDRLQTYAR
ncbi:MAG: hypothetical protein AMJ69_07840 [Gammaproteobacteria bacterium SG8_47]|nr:MAG: hypothetical protein AMJ69_07840 [Gammaproteobacteria bacterium SG8_47]